MLEDSPTTVLIRFQELLPPISRTMSTVPTAVATSMVTPSTSRAPAPPLKPWPKTRSSVGANRANVRYSGQVATMSQAVVVW